MTKISRPIIFLHGVNQDASKIGVPTGNASNNAFVPLITELKEIYDPRYIQVFKYLDDQSITPCPKDTYPPCRSQSSVTANAKELAKQIQALYASVNATPTTTDHHKVTLIGYSMGGAIIRTTLADCPKLVSQFPDLYEYQCAGVAKMVDNVFFINSVQQGSWLMALKNALDNTDNRVVRVLGWAILAAIKGAMGLDASYPGEIEMIPGSENVKDHDSTSPPDGIHYFNFFGDIQVHPTGDFFGPSYPPSYVIPVGDLVVLPGTDDPRTWPALGGSRFCFQCGDTDTFESYPPNQPNAATTYTQWPLTDRQDWNYTNALGAVLDLIGVDMTPDNGRQVLNNLLNAPEAHLKIYSDDSLNGTIKVRDITGNAGSEGKTSISNEILWIIEKEDQLPALQSPAQVGPSTTPTLTSSVGTSVPGAANSLLRFDDTINQTSLTIQTDPQAPDAGIFTFVTPEGKQYHGGQASDLTRVSGTKYQLSYRGKVQLITPVDQSASTDAGAASPLKNPAVLSRTAVVSITGQIDTQSLQAQNVQLLDTANQGKPFVLDSRPPGGAVFEVEKYHQALLHQDYATLTSDAAEEAVSGYSQQQFIQLLNALDRKFGTATTIETRSAPEIRTNPAGMTYFRVHEKVIRTLNGVDRVYNVVSVFVLDEGGWKFWFSYDDKS